MSKLIHNPPHRRPLFKRNMTAVIGICLSFYFSYHLLAGHRGYFSLISLERQMVEASEQYEATKAKREAVERKVVMMRPGSIDRDLLEERARYILGYQRADEVIIISENNN